MKVRELMLALADVSLDALVEIELFNEGDDVEVTGIGSVSYDEETNTVTLTEES